MSSGTLLRRLRAEPPLAGSPEPVASSRSAHLHVALAERRAVLVLGDLLWLNLSLALCVFVLPQPSWLVVFDDSHWEVAWFLVLSGIWLLAGSVTDLFELETAASRFGSPYRALGITAATLIAYSLVPVVTPPILKSRLMLAALAVTSMTLLTCWRFVFALVVRHPALLRRVLVVGGGQPATLIAEAIGRHPASGYQLVGYVDGESDGRNLSGAPFLGTTGNLESVVDSVPVEELVVAASGPMLSQAYHAITRAYQSGVRVTPMVLLYERLTGKTPVQHAGDYWLTMLPESTEVTASYALAKRALDLVGGLIGLAVLAVVLVPLAIAIRLESPGPVFFTQTRLGRRGTPFKIYKFRSVAVGGAVAAESIWERKATVPTRIGWIMRRMRLDELPQFINILKGEMSLVGPRPFVPEEVEELERHIPFFRSRLLVPPGLTGWAQVKATYGTTLSDELEKLQYDLYYIRHRSLALDTVVLIKTLAVVFRLAGR